MDTSRAIEDATSLERQLIAGIIIRPKDFYVAEQVVTDADFVDEPMKRFWQALSSMAKDGVEFWRESVMVAELRKYGAIQFAGGDAAFAELLTKTTPGHVLYHSEEVAKCSERRRVTYVIEEAYRRTRENAFDCDELIQRLNSRLSSATRESSEEVVQVGESMLQYLDKIELMRQTKSSQQVYRTGFAELDELLSGGLPCGYSILAARPSIGKSALAMDIGINAATNGNPVLFCSLEMSSDQINQRLMVRGSSVAMSAIQSLTYSDGQATDLMVACSGLASLPLYVWQASGATIGRLEARIRSEVAKRGVKVAIIDYLGLIRGEDAKKSIYERVTNVSNELARISKQLNIALLVLCQLGRAAEGEVPTIAMLRDSGAIEQDADVIMLLHREKRDSEQADLLLEKQRNGAIGRCELKFDGKRFTDAFHEASDMHDNFKGL